MSDLEAAMLALYAVLCDLEVEHANTESAAALCPSRRQRRGLENLAERYAHQLNALRQFFDWGVYRRAVDGDQVAA